MPVLLTNRALMGAGEGVTFPSVQNLVKGWVPPDARTRALSFVYSGVAIGSWCSFVVVSPMGVQNIMWLMCGIDDNRVLSSPIPCYIRDIAYTAI